jgi:hypothetical protein
VSGIAGKSMQEISVLDDLLTPDDDTSSSGMKIWLKGKVDG